MKCPYSVLLFTGVIVRLALCQQECPIYEAPRTMQTRGKQYKFFFKPLPGFRNLEVRMIVDNAEWPNDLVIFPRDLGTDTVGGDGWLPVKVQQYRHYVSFWPDTMALNVTVGARGSVVKTLKTGDWFTNNYGGFNVYVNGNARVSIGCYPTDNTTIPITANATTTNTMPTTMNNTTTPNTKPNTTTPNTTTNITPNTTTPNTTTNSTPNTTTPSTTTNITPNTTTPNTTTPSTTTNITPNTNPNTSSPILTQNIFERLIGADWQTTRLVLVGGITGGVVLLLVMVIIIVCLAVNKRRNKNKSPTTSKQPFNNLMMMQYYGHETDLEEPTYEEFDEDALYRLRQKLDDNESACPEEADYEEFDEEVLAKLRAKLDDQTQGRHKGQVSQDSDNVYYVSVRH